MHFNNLYNPTVFLFFSTWIFTSNGFVSFKAPADITKKEIAKAITFLYKDAKIIKISSLLVKGKKKRFKGKIGTRSNYKKFNIKLEKPIDITAGIK